MHRHLIIIAKDVVNNKRVTLQNNKRVTLPNLLINNKGVSLTNLLINSLTVDLCIMYDPGGGW